MDRSELAQYLDGLLEVSKFRDYCPNGLQVEGSAEVRRVLCGVTACQALLDAAVAEEADTVLVHHGYFWRGEETRVTGHRRRRLATLLGHDINLFAYHLPLDAHPDLGNNACFARLMDWQAEGVGGEQNLLWHGRPDHPEAAWQLSRTLAARLGRDPLLLGDGERIVRRLAWCTGAAQSFFEAALELGVDAFVSGEVSEQTAHLARETGVPYLAVGHHASERYGIQALGRHVADRFGIEVRFLDISNPV